MNIFLRNASLAYSEIVFENLTLTFKSNQCTCLLGQSGVGKSTLLRAISGLHPDSHFKGEITTDPGSSLRNNISFMNQDDLLFPWLNAFDNALFGIKLNGRINSQIKTKAHQLFAELGLTNAEKKFPWQLSGGMRQRVALARTLLLDKPIILMDEPFSALDTVTRMQLQNLAAEFLKNKTVLLVTHDPLEALRLADEIYIMHGKPATLTSHVTLTSNKPRDPSDPEFIVLQSELFKKLLQVTES